MKKFGKFIIRNRVVLVLLTIIIICGVLALYYGFQVFWGDTSDNKYGTRLDDIKEVEFSSEMQNEVTNYINTNKEVTEVKYDVQGKIIYLMIDFKSDVALADSQKLCTNSLKKFDKNVLKLYDIQFVLTASSLEKSKIYPQMGYKAKKSSKISWVNK